MLNGQQHKKEIIMSKLIIADTTVGINQDGMYCLNHLHKAAMDQGKASDHHKPANFMRNSDVSAFIAALESEAQICASKTVKGGRSGTWAVELVAMKYAGWIDPSYEVQVYRAVQALKHGDIEKAVSLSGSKEARRALDEKYKAQTIELQIKNAKALCEFLPHLGESSKQAIAANLVNPVAGFDVVPLPRIEEKFYTTTEIAKELDSTAQMIGRLANQHNLKTTEFGEFRLSQSKYSSKQVEQFYWNAAGREAIRDIVARARS